MLCYGILQEKAFLMVKKMVNLIFSKVQLWYIGLKKAMEINGTQLTCAIMKQQQQQSTNTFLHYMSNHMTMSYKHINKNTFPQFFKSKSLYTHEIPTVSEIKLHISC